MVAVMKITLEQFEYGEEMMIGFCRACGAERESCEPDARNYPCEECGKKQVFGTQELLLRGLVE